MAIKLKQKIFVVSLLLLLLLLLWLIYKYKNVSDSFTNNIEYYIGGMNQTILKDQLIM